MEIALFLSGLFCLVMVFGNRLGVSPLLAAPFALLFLIVALALAGMRHRGDGQ